MKPEIFNLRIAQGKLTEKEFEQQQKDGLLNFVDPRSGKTALHYATEYGRDKIIQALLDKGANPNVQDKKDNSPLHLACFKPHYSAIKCLIENFADATLKNQDQKTPLMCLAKHNTGLNPAQHAALELLKKSMLDNLLIKDQPAFPVFHPDGRLEIYSNFMQAYSASQKHSKKELKAIHQEISAYEPNTSKSATLFFQKPLGNENFIPVAPKGAEKILLNIHLMKNALPHNIYPEGTKEAEYLRKLERIFEEINFAWYSETIAILDEIENTANLDSNLLAIASKLRKEADELHTNTKLEFIDNSFSLNL